jgi:hypothetical protein
MPPPKTWPRAKAPPEEQQSQKKSAGKKSGCARAGRAELRRSVIQVAFSYLKPTHKYQPYSDDSIDALQRQYLHLLGKGSSAVKSRTPLTNDEVISSVSSINSFDDLEEVYLSLRDKGDGAARPRATQTDDELDRAVSVQLTLADLSASNRQALLKAKRETLKKDMKLLGIRSMRQIKRSG